MIIADSCADGEGVYAHRAVAIRGEGHQVPVEIELSSDAFQAFEADGEGMGGNETDEVGRHVHIHRQAETVRPG